MKSNPASKVISKKKSSGGIFETIKTIIYAVLIALVVRTVAYEPFNIPSGSMIPALLVGDYLFVSKFSYGYSRYSLPFDLPLFSGRIFSRPPERGDIAVFKLPTDNSTDYIKRIVGLPGDRIQMRNGLLYINDKLLPRRQIEDYIDRDHPGSPPLSQYIETLPNGRDHRIILGRERGNLLNVPATNNTICDMKLFDMSRYDAHNTCIYVVPSDHYFGMGDNRDSSQDSRVLTAVGYIPAANLVGRAEFIFFSTDGSAHWWEVWRWPFAIRYSRLFQAAH